MRLFELARAVGAALVLAAVAAVASASALRGVVVDRDGRGVEGVSIYVETDPNRPADVVAARTDAAGAFEIPRVAAGRVLLRAWHPSYAPAVVPEVRVGAGAQPLRITLGAGARVEGVVSHRDGRAFTAGRVIVQSSAPAAVYAPPQPLVPDEAGLFVAEHLSPGTARVFVLAFTPQRAPPGAGPVITLSPIATAVAELLEGETTTLEIALRDVVVSGRVTRGGAGVGGVRVTLSGPTRSISFPGMKEEPRAVAAAPPMLSATTRDDGTYELVAFEPGPGRVSLSEAVTGAGLGVRPVLVADADHFTLDVEITEAGVAGVVVGKEDGTPLPEVALRLTPLDTPTRAPVAAARTRADGRFTIGAESGNYSLSAQIPGRVRIERRVVVPPDGLADLRLEMDRGLAITGRLLDERGRPAPAQSVFASGSDGFERAFTRRDGTFRIEGLTDRPYALSAGSSLAGFATRRGVHPGPEPVTLALRAGGRIALRVLSPERRPVAQAVASVVAVDGERVDPDLCVATPTASDGTTTFHAPAGELALAVSAERGASYQIVAVAPGQTAAVEVRLERAPEQP